MDVILTVAPMASHDQESHIAPHVNCLDLINAMVPFMMLLALCGAGANGFTLPKETFAYHFICIYLRENIDAFYDAVAIM